MTLNDTEKAVLIALIASSAGNGHDFGFTDEIPESVCTKAQRSGYVSSLEKKGFINCFTHDPEWKNGFELTEKGRAFHVTPRA